MLRSWTPCFISRPPSRTPGAKEEDTVSFREHQDKVRGELWWNKFTQCLTQVRENLGICLTIFGIVMVAVIVTTIKIFFFDKDTYPSLFYTPEEIEAMTNKTVNNLAAYQELYWAISIWCLTFQFDHFRETEPTTLFSKHEKELNIYLLLLKETNFNKTFSNCSPLAFIYYILLIF